MTNWSLEDAPELHRLYAMNQAHHAVGSLVAALRFIHWGVSLRGAAAWLKQADEEADRALEHATRYRNAKRAVSELRNTLHDFELFCRDLCEKDPDYYTLDHAVADHADMLEEIDWEDDNDVCF